jgi:hypothetical protein
MAYAAMGGHRDVVVLMLGSGASDYNWAIHSAAEGGHRDIVDMLMKKRLP